MDFHDILLCYVKFQLCYVTFQLCFVVLSCFESRVILTFKMDIVALGKVYVQSLVSDTSEIMAAASKLDRYKLRGVVQEWIDFDPSDYSLSGVIEQCKRSLQSLQRKLREDIDDLDTTTGISVGVAFGSLIGTGIAALFNGDTSFGEAVTGISAGIGESANDVMNAEKVLLAYIEKTVDKYFYVCLFTQLSSLSIDNIKLDSLLRSNVLTSLTFFYDQVILLIL